MHVFNTICSTSRVQDLDGSGPEFQLYVSFSERWRVISRNNFFEMQVLDYRLPSIELLGDLRDKIF